MSVVAYLNAGASRLIERDFNFGGAGIQRVLNELFNYRRWPLYDFASSYQVGHRFRQRANRISVHRSK